MYTENGKSYSRIPEWVESMIRLGYEWRRDRIPWKGRVCFVSMPCKSAAAALIVLGALRKDLEKKDADNINGHFESLCRARDAFCNSPEMYDGYVRDDRNKKWKFLYREDGSLFVEDANYKEVVKRKGRMVQNPNGPGRRSITKYSATDWRLEGDAVIEIKEASTGLNKTDYKGIPGCTGLIDENNLRRSYKGLLFVGDGKEKDSIYMRNIYDVKFGGNGQQVSLGDLLTIHPSSNGVTRANFCNYSKVEFQSKDYYLVVADGHSAILKALTHFSNSDIIGIYSRDDTVDGLMNIANRLGEIGRYYSRLADCEFSGDFSSSVVCSCMEVR